MQKTIWNQFKNVEKHNNKLKSDAIRGKCFKNFLLNLNLIESHHFPADESSSFTSSRLPITKSSCNFENISKKSQMNCNHVESIVHLSFLRAKQFQIPKRRCTTSERKPKMRPWQMQMFWTGSFSNQNQR